MGAAGPKRMEIEWMSFATGDAEDQVVAFYERDQKTKASQAQDGGYRVEAAKNPRDKMSIVAREKASRFPSCETRARLPEQTVIIVSRATGG